MAKHNWKYIESFKELKQVIQYCKQTGYCSHDFETSSLDFSGPLEYPLEIGICFQVGFTYILPLAHSESPFKNNWRKYFDLFCREVIEDPSITKIAWNIGFEHKWFLRYGFDYRGRWFDGMLAKYLLDEERPFSLESQVKRFFHDFDGYKDDTENLAKKHGSWAKIPLEDLSKRCALDCDLTFRLMIRFEEKLIKGGFYKIFRSLIMPLERVIAESEFEGIPIDVVYLDKMIDKYQQLIDNTLLDLKSMRAIRKYEKHRKKAMLQRLVNQVNQEINEIRESGKPNAERLISTRTAKIANYLQGKTTNNKDAKLLEPLNFGSPTQLVDFLFLSKKGLRLPILSYTLKDKKPTKNPSTDEAALLELKKHDNSGFMDKLLKYRELCKLNSTYLVGVKEKVTPENKIHARFKIFGTVTGRLSSSDPNMQNVPRCLHEDHIIITNKGLMKIGDLVPESKGWHTINDPNLKALTHKGRYKPITHGVNKGYLEMIEVTLSDGSILKCTESHVMLTSHGWKSVGEVMRDSNIKIIKHA